MANDYNGYIASYREYQRGDHYRKALTAWGPHSADYLATRLVTLGRLMKDPDHPLPTDQQQQEDPTIQSKIVADNVHNDLRAQAYGIEGAAAVSAYEAKLPDDGGEARAVTEPEDVERFGVALFTWNGGSNFTDNPDVRVQRKVGGAWLDYADGSGELPVTLKFPQAGEVPAHEAGGVRVGVDRPLRALRIALRPRRPPAGDPCRRLPVRSEGRAARGRPEGAVPGGVAHLRREALVGRHRRGVAQGRRRPGERPGGPAYDPARARQWRQRHDR